MIKYLFAGISFLALFFSFAQTDVTGKINTEITEKQELGFAVHLPINTKDKKHVIIFLYGAGEKGTDIEKVKVHGPFKYIKSHDLDAYVLDPQCPKNEYWDSEVLYQLILKIKKENVIDPNKIYLTG
jgi:predicted peptidase